MKESDSLTRLAQHDVFVIPEKWKISKIKYIGNYINGYPFKPTDWGTIGRPIIRIQNLSNTDSEFNRYDDEIPKKYLIKSDDLLISWSASLGIFKWNGEEAWLNQHIFKVEPNEKLILKDYFLWLAEWFIFELERDVHGSTMQHLTADAFGSFPLLLPPISLQQVITNFLEKETSYIDTLIAAKKRLLSLLVEKRQALITHSVIRGINPNVVLINSNVEWLGDIPAHWKIIRSKWLLKERNERSVTGDEELLTVSHKTGVTRRSEKDVNMFEAESTEGYKIAYANDLVINTLWAWMGAMGISPIKGITSPAYHVYTLSQFLEPDYVDLIVRTPVFAQEVTRYSKGVWSSRLRLYPEGLYEVKFPLPPVEEQRLIVVYIKEETRKIDELQKATEKSIELLKERRSALITAVVTGKMKI